MMPVAAIQPGAGSGHATSRSASTQIDFWIYRFDHGLTPAVRDRCAALLTDEERDRVARFQMQDRRDQALIARALSRRALSRRFDVKAEDWRFSVTERGRPFVAGEDAAIDFNLSHAAGCVVCAVAQNIRVGIDVERLARADDIHEVSTRVFSKAERERLESGGPDAPVRLWTVKEAYAKALGLGLGIDFRMLDFDFDTQFSDITLPGAKGAWRFESAVDEGVACALAHDCGVGSVTISYRDAACML